MKVVYEYIGKTVFLSIQKDRKPSLWELGILVC